MYTFLFSLLICSIVFNQKVNGQGDTITTTQFIKDGETIVSSGGSFELGFFSPGETSTNSGIPPAPIALTLITDKTKSTKIPTNPNLNLFTILT